MAEALVVNGTTYNYPDLGDQNWGTDATNWAVAITNGTLQKAGGSFTLTADVDFGANFGLKSIYLKSRATNPSSAGVLRLGNTETIGWRNFANGGNVLLGCNTSDRIQWNSVDLADVSSTQTFTNKTLTNPVIDTASFSGVVYLSNGSAATPSLAFTNLTASGLFKKGTGLGFTTGGVEAGSIDSSGNWSFAAAVTITGTLLSGNITSSAFISQTSNPAGAGAIRLANSDSIKFRNSGNSGDVALATGSSNSVLAYASIDLVNLSTAQTLTNKTLSGNTAVTLISGSGTLTLNTSGTVTLPNATDTLVGKATTDTLTNKTISGGSNTLSAIGDSSLSVSYVKADGSRPLTADWATGNFRVTIGNASVSTSGYLYVGNQAAAAGILTATNQQGIAVDYTVSSNATVGAQGVDSFVRTANSSFTCPVVSNFKADTISKGAASTITRSIQYEASGDLTVGTNNAIFADNESFSGNWALNLASTNPSKFSGPVQIKGYADASSAAAGYVGELLSASTSSVNAPSNGQFGDLVSLSITAGRWLLLCTGEGLLGSGTGMINIGLGIGTATGNSSTGVTSGTNFHTAPPPTSAYASSVTVSQMISISSTTTYYGKTYAEYGGGTPTFRGTLFAVRI